MSYRIGLLPLNKERIDTCDKLFEAASSPEEVEEYVMGFGCIRIYTRNPEDIRISQYVKNKAIIITEK